MKVRGVTLGRHLGIVLGILFLLTSNANADRNGRTINLPARTSSSSSSTTEAPIQLARAIIRKHIEDNGDKDANAILNITKIPTDDIRVIELNNGKQAETLYQDDAVNALADTMSRKDARYAVVLGASGSGKSSVIDEFARRAVLGELDGEYQSKTLANLVLFKITAREVVPGGTDFGYYMAVVNRLKKELNLNIVVEITEAQYLTNYHGTVLHEWAAWPNHVPVIIESDFKTYSSGISELESIKSLINIVPVKELTSEELTPILQAGILPDLKKRMNVSFSDEVVEAVIKIASDYKRDSSEPRRSMMLLEDFAIQFSRTRGEQGQRPTRADLFKFVAKKTGVPVVPQDEEAFAKFIADLRADLHKEVVAQDALVDGLVDQFRTALTSGTRKHSVAMIMGPTGVGKTYTAERLAERFYGTKSRVLEVDMAQFMSSEKESVLFGAANGLVSSNTMKGVICEFLDGPGNGGGIIILNEIEKAHSKIITRMMELFDKGQITCGDGRTRYLGRSLIVMTSNKNTESIIPADTIANMSQEELDARLARITPNDLKSKFTEKASYTQDDSEVVTTPVVERVDKWYFAGPLLLQNAIGVANMEVAKFVKDHESQSSTKLIIDPSFAETLTNAFYSPKDGARQLRNAVNQSLSSAISDASADFKERFGTSTTTFKISAYLHPSKKTESYVTISDADHPERTMTVNGPRIPVTNKLLDEAFREKLIHLEENLSKEILGQPEAVSAIASVVRARYLRSTDGRPASIFLMGTTGTGKSELARMVAVHLYGRIEAVGKFDMGQIKEEHDLATIFSPAKGIIGSDEPGELEQFLMKFPDGGVLLFDEISNAGGNNVQLKNSIIKRFYQMLQEGYFTSPSGKKYDLSKYLIVFTGNDGEQLFKGAGSESMINLIYDDIKKHPGKAKDVLRQNGFSDAFLGRVSNVTVMRPATGASKLTITDKMLNRWRKEVIGTQPIDIEMSPGFVEKVSRLMFTYKSGARSIEEFIDNVLGKEVANMAYKLDWNTMIANGTRAKIVVDADTIEPHNPFFEGDEPDTKSAHLKVTAIQNGVENMSSAVEFTEFAQFTPQLYVGRARFTAYHEMGHAMASYSNITGKKVMRISIIPQEFFEGLAAGITEYKLGESKLDNNWTKLIMQVAGLLAGSEAEVIAGGDEHDTNTGRSNDVERAGQTIRRFILENHMIKDFDAAHAYLKKGDENLGNLPKAMREALEKKVQEAIDEGRALAQKTLKENWSILDAGARLLMKFHELGEEDFKNLLAAGAKARAEGHMMTHEAGYLMNIDEIPITGKQTGHPAAATTAAASVTGTCATLLKKAH